MQIDITKRDIDHALASSLWDLGNEVLYRLCREHPKHDRADAVVAKVWLIGRSYAAAIERRKNARDDSDDFYEKNVVQGMVGPQIDDWLAGLPDQVSEASDLVPIVEVHWRLVNLFRKMTGLEKRSLASKYLHFHRPELFFIYDSRARNAIVKVTPHLRQIIKDINGIASEITDSEYQRFCLRAQWLRKQIKKDFDKDLNPREIDKLLLNIAKQNHMA